MNTLVASQVGKEYNEGRAHKCECSTKGGITGMDGDGEAGRRRFRVEVMK